MFYAIPNLSSYKAFEIEKPWEFKTPVVPPYDRGKDAVTRWSQHPNTNHAFISGYEGMTATVRVSKNENPPCRMHALVVDYDTPLTDDRIKNIMENPTSDVKPMYIVRTTRGYARLVWLFEKPMLYGSEFLMENFLRQLKAQLDLAHWLPSLDTKAYGHRTIYFELGRDWIPVPEATPISRALLEHWMLLAASGISLDSKQLIHAKIPLEDVKQELDSQFPGRWKGQFTLNSRGVRFWDASADNETAAVVREDGMMCFTGDSAFVSWREIFGKEFVGRYESERIAGVLSTAYYDGNMFWVDKDGDNNWVDWSKNDYTQKLRVLDYESIRRKGANCSEIDRIENMIKENKRVVNALPFLFRPKGYIIYKGQPFINTSRVSVAVPVAELSSGPMTWANGHTYFPAIHQTLRSLFVPADDPGGLGLVQFSHFLSWLQYFYVNAYNNKPRQGQAIVIAGPPNQGKTLFCKFILGPLMGGYEDATDHLVNGSPWTERVLNSPIMAVEDALGASDAATHTQFSARVKKYIANAEMIYNQKYRKTSSMDWLGRIIITCNTDSESLKIMPNMDMSSKDKICLFKTTGVKADFSNSVTEQIAQEIPYFARFLLDWQMPQYCVPKFKRFGVVTYHHPELYDEAREQQGVGTLVEMLLGMLEVHQTKTNNTVSYWDGTAIQLYEDMCVVYPGVMREIRSPRALATMLGNLVKAGYRLTKHKETGTGKNIWKIYYNLTGQLNEVNNE